MDFTEAIKLAQAGEEKGFTFLYEETYKSKYYLALQYMKNEEAAQDVLQEAYIKAFSKLDTLSNPEAFSRWLGKIVANTAKNALVKKNPMLFSDMAVDDQNEEFEYQIEDDSVEYQPETAYTRQETQQLVHELMDTLSEDQRICILMFHIEGISIKEIAFMLECSENTVKSRLKYGRDNLKRKAEELQKKGYKLYSVAPTPLLLYLLREEYSYLSAGSSFSAVGTQLAKQLFHSSAAPSDAGASVVGKNVINGSTQAAKSGFLHTAAGKITVAVVGLCIAGGAIFYGISQMNSDEPIPETEVVEEQNEEPEEVEKEVEDESVENGQTIEAIYAEVRKAVANKEPGYDFSSVEALTGIYGYFLYDMDGDGIEELIVSAEYEEYNGAVYARACRVYSCEKLGSGYALKTIGGEIYVDTLYIMADGSGLYHQEFSRGTGKVAFYKVMIQDGEFVTAGVPEYQCIFGDDAHTAFTDTNELVQWIDIPSETKSTQAVFPGTYQNGVGSSIEVRVEADGQIMVIDSYGEHLMDMNNVQADGGILGYVSEMPNGDMGIRIFVYPIGTKLSVYDNAASMEKETDSNQTRLFYMFQDVPDFNSNVYYLVN